jgi:hypothetical protein
MPREEPFNRLVRTIQEERNQRARDLVVGQWKSESEARELVGRIAALEFVLEEMRNIAGPGTDFGEVELT